MKKIAFLMGTAVLMAFTIFISCQKSSEAVANTSNLTADEKSLIKSAGFNSNWAERTATGSYLIEDDILLSKTQLEQMANVPPVKNFIVANQEHYRTTELVNTGGGIRTITVSLGSGFPSYYSTGLDQALVRYNSLGLNLVFQRVSSGGQINITGANLGRTIGGGCILGQAGGFPSGGNPGNGFILSTSKCATTYLNTANKVDEVIAHEMGHCIGFRHTDYTTRASCGQNSNEGDAGVGAIHIPGTPTTVPGSYDSWMMACTNGNPLFNADDVVALQYVY
jgi:Zn-dependent protease with chaperone function